MFVKLISSVNLEQVQLFITPNPAFIVSRNIFFLKDLNAFDEHSFEVSISLNQSQNFDICFGEFVLMVSFTNRQSIIRVIKHTVDIPLKVVLRNDNPQKDGMFKITLSVFNPTDLKAILKGELMSFELKNSDYKLCYFQISNCRKQLRLLG